jgi:hypothetical protein
MNKLQSNAYIQNNLNENLQMNLGQRNSDDYKLRLRNTGMKHYKCMAYERQGWITSVWFSTA